MTGVQTCALPFLVGRASVGGAAAPPGSADDRASFERVLAHPGESMAFAALMEGRGQARLVDAFALYAPDAGEREAVFDGPPTGDGAPATRAATSGQTLSPEACNLAQHLLARRLGPVAGVLVKRAADMAGGSRPVFVMNLLAEVPGPHRDTFRAELEAVLDPPQRTGFGR